jgi:DNA-binding NarL/FixJ family response regulator
VWNEELAQPLLEEVEKHHSFIQMMKKEITINMPTHREIEIAKCILAGMDNEDIGKKLYLSTGTIKNIIAVILEKYHFRSRAQIISLLAL